MKRFINDIEKIPIKYFIVNIFLNLIKFFFFFENNNILLHELFVILYLKIGIPYVLYNTAEYYEKDLVDIQLLFFDEMQ